MKHEKFIAIPKYTLLLAGVWPSAFTENKLYTIAYEVYKKIQSVLYGLYVLSLTIELCVLIIRENQSSRMFGSLTVLVNVIPDAIKIILYYVKQIPQMLHQVSKYEGEVLFSRDRKIEDYYKRQVNYCRKVNILQLFATSTACILFGAVAYIRLATAEDTSVFKDQPLIHDLWLPFKQERHMNVVIIFSSNALLQGYFYNISTRTAFTSLMIFAGTRLRILQLRLRKLDIIAKKEYNGDVLLTVKELIKEHQFLIRFVKSLNDRTKYVTLMEFVLNSINVASTTMQLLMVRSTTLMFVVVMLLNVLSHIFVLSWSANKIQEESLGISTAILESNWVDQTIEVKKLLLIMTMQSQRPLGMSVGPFFQMTTKTALMTIKIAYSYLSVMMQSYQDKMK